MKILLYIACIETVAAVGAIAQSVPSMMNYQGRLANQDGSPFPTADYSLSVRIWDSTVNGSVVWGPQIFDGTVTAGHGPIVPVIQGYFNLMLGPVDTNGASLSDVFTATNRFLEMTVSNRPAIQPRQRILSTPFAMQAGNGSPAGTIAAFGGTNIPAGWLLCDGRSMSSIQYPLLYSAISSNWGAGTSLTTNDFNLPDLRGVFLRGVNPSGSRTDIFADPNDHRVARIPGGATGNQVGSFQGQEISNHNHRIAISLDSPRFSGNINISSVPLENTFKFSSSGSFGTANGGDGSFYTGGSETRPKNAAVNYIIKY